MYRIFDFLLDSNIPLPELPESTQGDILLSFLLSSSPPPTGDKLSWFHHFRLPDGEITISCARRGDDYYLRFPQIADFLITEIGDTITCYPCPGTPDHSIRHLLLDQVIPRVAAHNGRIVLHASAVQLGTGCVVFLGETGWGKSTLAASFHQNGYQLLTDDCLMLQVSDDDVAAIPSYAGSRLWTDSTTAILKSRQNLHQMAHYSAKKRLIIRKTPASNGEDIPVRAFFVLGSPRESAQKKGVSITPPTGAQVLMEIVKHSFHLDVTDRERIRGQFHRLGQLVNKNIPFYRLAYPHDHALLPDVQASIVKAAE